MKTNLQEAIRDTGLTNKEFAKSIGIPKVKLDSILNGEPAKQPYKRKIEEALDIELEEPEKVKITPIPAHFKQENYRDKKLLSLAKGRSCSNPECGKQDGTIVRAHYTGIRQHLFGKAKGLKGHDWISADLCSTCHTMFDQPRVRKSVELSELFLTCIILTIERDRDFLFKK